MKMFPHYEYVASQADSKKAETDTLGWFLAIVALLWLGYWLLG